MQMERDGNAIVKPNIPSILLIHCTTLLKDNVDIWLYIDLHKSFIDLEPSVNS